VTPEQIAILTPEERRAWESLAAFDATGRDIVARRLTGERTSAPMNRHMPGAEAHLRVALTTIANLRARLVTGIGLPLGVNDRNGNPVHVGDTLAFDGREWTRTCDAPDHIYTVEFRNGQVLVDGTVGDIRHYCRVVKRWDAPTTEAT